MANNKKKLTAAVASHRGKKVTQATINRLRADGCLDTGLTVYESIRALQALVKKDPDLNCAVLYMPGGTLKRITDGNGLEVYLHPKS